MSNINAHISIKKSIRQIIHISCFFAQIIEFECFVWYNISISVIFALRYDKYIQLHNTERGILQLNDNEYFLSHQKQI